jgi:integrase
LTAVSVGTSIRSRRFAPVTFFSVARQRGVLEAPRSKLRGRGHGYGESAATAGRGAAPAAPLRNPVATLDAGRADSTLVFPGATVSGYLTPKVVAGELYRAMAKAGVAREGSSGAKRSFHSFRHSHAAMALGADASISWLQRRLGHASITITVDRYGHFEAATRKAEAAKLEDVFRL